MPTKQNDLESMAKKNFGYGRWQAPFWFIGPEQGMAKGTASDQSKQQDDLRRRTTVWLEMGSQELNDCREFHRLLPESRWHFETPVKPQKTWSALILVLMAGLGRKYDLDSRKNYQRDRWGSAEVNVGETCAVELSGLPSPRLKRLFDADPHIEERIQTIRQRIADHKPRLVFMYGLKQVKYWNKIAGGSFQVPVKRHFKLGPTVYVLAPHPSRPTWMGKVLGNDDWVSLGEELRRLYPDLFSDH